VVVDILEQVFVFVGGSIQLALRPVVDWILVPATGVDEAIQMDHNWGFALVVGSGQLYMARVLSSFIYTDCADFIYFPDYHCSAMGADCPDEFTPAPVGFTAGLCDASDEVLCLSNDYLSWGAGGSFAAKEPCQPASSMGLGERLVQTEYHLRDIIIMARTLDLD
jgi:hypothetical protein